ncbi:MAG: thioredoxin family protein [Bacteroidetes bacterium]|nr:MAG: thioredoxin family protein [Bacteroidota bacterium]
MKKLSFLLIALLINLLVFAQEGYKVGDKGMDFSLKNIDGKMFSLASVKDAKGFIVVFTCNHCPFSKLYEDRIIALNKEFAPKGYSVVAINPNDVKAEPDDSFEKMQERAKEKGFTFPYLVDESQKIAKTYGAARTPHAFILQKQGAELKVVYIGAIDNNSESATAADKKYVEDAIHELLEGKKPTITSTKAVGCSIKWKE